MRGGGKRSNSLNIAVATAAQSPSGVVGHGSTPIGVGALRSSRICLRSASSRTRNVSPKRTIERLSGELVDAALDGLWAYHRSDPAIRAILRNLHLYGTFAKADQALMQEFIGHTRDILLRKSRGLSRPRATLLATMVVNVISGLLLVCEREEEKLARRMIAETKVLLRRYLEGERVFIS